MDSNSSDVPPISPLPLHPQQLPIQSPSQSPSQSPLYSQQQFQFPLQPQPNQCNPSSPQQNPQPHQNTHQQQRRPAAPMPQPPVDVQALFDKSMTTLREKLFRYEKMLQNDDLSEKKKEEVKAQHSKVKGVMRQMLRITMSPNNQVKPATAINIPKRRTVSSSNNFPLPSPIQIPKQFGSRPESVGGIPAGFNLGSSGDDRHWSSSAPATPPLKLPNMRSSNPMSIPSFHASNENFTTTDGLSMSPGPTRMMQDGREFTASLQDFTKVAPIGKGAHGTVYKVTSTTVGVGEPMAMKEILLGDATQRKVDRITRELNIMKKARGNPYIVELHAQYYDQRMFSIIMEYMNAGSLESLVKAHYAKQEEGLPEDVIAHTTRSTVRGLRFLYDEMQVIHRDVKPSNILASLDGRIKICDFGICADLGLQDSVTSYIGTLYYMAPERIVPQQDKSYGPTVDIWSMGVSIVELAIGQYPYPKDEKVFEMLQHIVYGPTAVEREPFASMKFETDLIRELCTDCLQKKPNQRPSYSEVLEHPFLDLEDNTNEVIREWLRSIGMTKADVKPTTHKRVVDVDCTPRPTQDFESDGMFDTAVDSNPTSVPVRDRINTL